MKVAIVRVRGTANQDTGMKDTLEMLNLDRPNNCVVLEFTPVVKGMLRKVASRVTWGAVDDKTLAELKKKGEKVFRLNPPKKGYGRKGVKMPFSKGGALGDRGDKINDLLARMM